MSHSLIIRPEAEDDLAQARDWYDGRRPGLGREFLLSVDELFERKQKTPEFYAQEHKTVRRAGLDRFPYVVYYRITAHALEVIAVLHGRRDPQVWRWRA